MNLYWNVSDFTLNSDERLNDKLVSAMQNALVCEGDGRLSRDSAINLIENALQGIAADEAALYGNEFEWDVHLVQIHTFTENHPNYEIEFTVVVTPKDSDIGRKVPNVDSAEKLGITFAIRNRISFTRNVQYLCNSCPDCTGPANCGDPGTIPYCSGNSKVWWSAEGQTDDCGSCYCENMENCSPDVCSGGSCEPFDPCAGLPCIAILTCENVIEGNCVSFDCNGFGTCCCQT